MWNVLSCINTCTKQQCFIFLYVVKTWLEPILKYFWIRLMFSIKKPSYRWVVACSQSFLGCRVNGQLFRGNVSNYLGHCQINRQTMLNRVLSRNFDLRLYIKFMYNSFMSYIWRWRVNEENHKDWSAVAHTGTEILEEIQVLQQNCARGFCTLIPMTKG